LVPLSNGGYSENQLCYFQGAGDGAYPFGGVIVDSSDNLYGSTMDIGFDGAGAAFKLTPAGNGTWSYAPLYSFAGGTSCGPYANLALDGAGNLYGTTYCSTGVFKLTPAGTFTPLPGNVQNPISNVTFDASGNLYGTASQGGNTACNTTGFGDCGVVWKITP